MRRPRSRSLGCVVVLVVALALPAATGAAAASNHEITITVTTVDRSGEPVGGVDFAVSWNNGANSTSSTTNPNGKEFVAVPAGADISIAITDGTYLRNFPVQRRNVRADDEYRVQVSLPARANVSVVDDGGPVTDAAVAITGNGADITRRTGSDGHTTLGPVTRDEYDIQVSKAGYLTNSTSIDLTGNVSTTVRIHQADRRFSVRVADDHFSPPRPVANASVSVAGVGTFTTGSGGERSVGVSVNRDYEVAVSKSGYESVTRTVSVDESDVSRTITIRREDELTLSASSDRVVVGESTLVTVTDEYGEPVAGAVVGVGGTEAGTTDGDGQVSVPVGSAGNNTITASSGGLSATVTVDGVDPTTPTTTTPTPTPTTTTSTPTPTTTTSTPTTTAPTTTVGDGSTAGGGGAGFGFAVFLVALAGVALAAYARDA